MERNKYTVSVFKPSNLARKDLKKLQPYQPAMHSNVIRLDANESPYDFPPEVIDDINAGLGAQAFNRYPDPLADDLRAALAAYTGTARECILAGNGGDEIIQNLILTFATGGKVFITSPTFAMYEVHSLIAGAEPVFIQRQEDSGFAIDAGEIIRQENETGARLIFICSPNNPTANETAREELAAVLQNTKSLVVVDEAYVEFGGQTCVPLLKEYPNLAIIRSFSKSFGMAGLRVGYLLAHPGVIAEIMRIKQPFNLNNYSQQAALAVLGHLPLFQARIENIIEKRDRQLKEMGLIKGIQVLPSATNFITFKSRRPAADVQRELLNKGVLIRNASAPGFENYLRAAVGTSQENEIFLKSLRELL